MDNVIILVIMCLVLLELDSKYLFTSLIVIGVLYYAYLKRDQLKTFSLTKELNPDNPFNNKLPYMDKEINKFMMEVEPSQFDESKLKMYLDNNENKDMHEMYHKDIFQPLENYFQKNNGYRQFYHNPDRDNFANFLFGDKLPSCKDTASTCFPMYDNRFSKNM